MGVTRYLLDTGIAGHYINRRYGVFDRAKEQVAIGNRIGICPPIIGELFFGVENSTTRETNLKRMRHALSTLTIWPYDRKAAEEYGRIAARLKAKGRIIQQIDMQVAAVAKCLGNCVVVTADNDFHEVSGISIENWAES